ncbi:MAG: CpsB/CapC family capsule biosynthesis tyrosine phosphatase [Rhizobiaceae bacterium]
MSVTVLVRVGWRLAFGMIDLHSHILPGLDDGSPSLATSLEMARMAVDDGITHMACTPHIVPGLYDNDCASIVDRMSLLEAALAASSIKLRLFSGADVHIAPDLPEKLRAGTVPSINGSRYFLFEPPHHILPPKIEELAARLIKAGFVPILTHPERLTWIKSHYRVIENLNALGCLIQLTADSITGNFGKTSLYYSEKLIDEGRVDIIASDCHGTKSRRPLLSRARSILESRVGSAEAERMVLKRPAAILSNSLIAPAGQSVPPSVETAAPPSEKKSLLGRLLKGGAR